MHTLKLRIQIILVLLIAYMGHIHWQRLHTAQFDATELEKLEALAQNEMAGAQDDQYDVLKNALENPEERSAANVAQDLYRDIYNRDPDSTLVKAAVNEADKMVRSGDVSAYEAEINNNALLKRVIGR